MDPIWIYPIGMVVIAAFAGFVCRGKDAADLDSDYAFPALIFVAIAWPLLVVAALFFAAISAPFFLSKWLAEKLP